MLTGPVTYRRGLLPLPSADALRPRSSLLASLGLFCVTFLVSAAIGRLGVWMWPDNLSGSVAENPGVVEQVAAVDPSVLTDEAGGADEATDEPLETLTVAALDPTTVPEAGAEDLAAVGEEAGPAEAVIAEEPEAEDMLAQAWDASQSDLADMGIPPIDEGEEIISFDPEAGFEPIEIPADQKVAALDDAAAGAADAATDAVPSEDDAGTVETASPIIAMPKSQIALSDIRLPKIAVANGSLVQDGAVALSGDELDGAQETTPAPSGDDAIQNLARQIASGGALVAPSAQPVADAANAMAVPPMPVPAPTVIPIKVALDTVLPQQPDALPPGTVDDLSTDPGDLKQTRVALVIDDLGLHPARTEAVIQLPGTMTLSFLPYGGLVRPLARQASQAGHEIMLHLPMEPHGPQDPGPQALRRDLTPQDFDYRLAWAFSQFDGYAGFNNHMGSRLTEDWGAMKRLMEAMKGRGLYFLDSLTSPNSVAFKASRQAGMPTLVRHVFLDHDPSYDAVRRRLNQTLRRAKKQGAAIAIGHPYPSTVQALRDWMPEVAAMGVEFVPASALLAPAARQRVRLASRS